jgi:hypothetical protein
MLVKEGEVLEWMQGEYDSYGRVFKMDPRPYKSRENGLQGTTSSYDWTVMDWGDIVDLHFGSDSYSGIAAYHTGCFKGDMDEVCVSDDDPDQGWCDYKFPTEGTHDHGTTKRLKPKWAKAEGR